MTWEHAGSASAPEAASGGCKRPERGRPRDRDARTRTTGTSHSARLPPEAPGEPGPSGRLPLSEMPPPGARDHPVAAFGSAPYKDWQGVTCVPGRPPGGAAGGGAGGRRKGEGVGGGDSSEGRILRPWEAAAATRGSERSRLSQGAGRRRRGSASSSARAPPRAPPGAPLSGRLELFPEGPLATVLRGPFPRFIRFPTLHFIPECGAAAWGEEAAGPRGQRVAPGGDRTHLLTAPWQSPGHAGFRGPPPGEASSLQKPEPRLRLRWPLCPGLPWWSGDLGPRSSGESTSLSPGFHSTRHAEVESF
uniref:collagen alpha-1(I) chain-like n=1 Tax=Myodes glareolus TaxID=447135 RepID=UPI0020200F53|nr:collagen alpha-1(I) chain-like [Myodes glareolus]